MTWTVQEKIDFCYKLLKNDGACITTRGGCEMCLLNEEIHEVSDLCCMETACDVAKEFIRNNQQDKDNVI